MEDEGCARVPMTPAVGFADDIEMLKGQEQIDDME